MEDRAWHPVPSDPIEKADMYPVRARIDRHGFGDTGLGRDQQQHGLIDVDARLAVRPGGDRAAGIRDPGTGQRLAHLVGDRHGH